MAIMLVPLAIEKYNPSGTTFELNFFYLFGKLNPNLESQNIWIPRMAVLLATKKSNPTGTTFVLKFVCFG